MKIKNTFLTACISILLLFSLSTVAQTQLFGLTGWGGVSNSGTIIKMNSDGSGFTKVYDLTGFNGCTPLGNLIQAKNGKLYGAGMYCGDGGYGVIFSFNPISNSYQDLYDFNDYDSVGCLPIGGLTEGPDNLLYGTLFAGGVDGYGFIYSFNTNTHELKDLHTFDGVNGYRPAGGLLLGSDGKLYGTTTNDFTNEAGGIFSYDIASGTYTDLYHFANSGDVSGWGSLIEINGVLYGTTSGGAYPFNLWQPPMNITWGNFGSIYSYDIKSNTYTDLYHFNSLNDQGYYPFGALTVDTNGILYGTACYGGCCLNGGGVGVIFSLDPVNDIYKDLLNFQTVNGANPAGDLYLSTDGNFYGLTYNGGTDSKGVVFRFNPNNDSLNVIVNLDSVSGLNPMFGSFRAVKMDTTMSTLVTNYSNPKILSVYPVPTSGSVTVRIQSTNTSNVLFTLSDIEGKSLLKKQMNMVNGSLKTNIDLNTFSSGIYLLQVEIDGNKLTRKIVKE